MGWASCTEIFDRVIDAVRDVIDEANCDDEDKEIAYRGIVDAFIDGDWDDTSSSEYYKHPVIGPLLGNRKGDDIGCWD